MKPVEDLTVLVKDNGLFLPLAQKLAETCKRVLYTTSRKKGFALLNECLIGDGFDRVERIDDFWPIKNDIDLFVFPDIEDSGLQLELESQGFPVWGSRAGDSLEIYRQKFMRVLGEVGLQVPPFVTIKGLTALREHLRDKEDKFIKISKFRGSMETWKWRKWRLDEGFLDILAVRFGPAKELLSFMVFDEIDTDLEIGGDTYCVDDQFPSLMIHGLEWKDKGYLGSVMPYREMPDQLQDVMDALAPVHKDYRYRNFWSMEIRVDGENSYPIDPCCRFSSPGTAARLELYRNLPEIIWAGAHGELVEPVMTAKFAAECVLTTKSEKQQAAVVEFPTELLPHVKCGGCYELDGLFCFPPDETHGEEIGWLVAVGDTIKGTIETMKEYAALLPDGVHANTESLFELLKEAHSAEDQGVEFAERIPEPTVALEEKT